MDMGIRMCEYFIGMSTKMYYVFCKMRKLILAKQNLKKEKDCFIVLTWMLEFVTVLVKDTLDIVMREMGEGRIGEKPKEYERYES